MSALRGQLADYLAVRRALGHRLERSAKLLEQFVGHLEGAGTELITIADALAWATRPESASPGWRGRRLSAVRGFATWLHGMDARHEVPPAGLLPARTSRATPYIYSDKEITALMDAAAVLSVPVRVATFRTLIGLLAVSGLRIGEAIALDRSDFDPDAGVVTVRRGKFGKSREVPLHPSAVAALADYLALRDELIPLAKDPALFISRAGTRLGYCNVNRTFHMLVRRAGLVARSGSCRPRLHDVRHTFAVRTVLGWYRREEDVAALMPRLSTYLGHVNPSTTYWYLEATPELLAEAARRLERLPRGAR